MRLSHCFALHVFRTLHRLNACVPLLLRCWREGEREEQVAEGASGGKGGNRGSRTQQVGAV